MPEPPRAARAPWWFSLIVSAAAVAVYANALPNAFVWDDETLIVGNPLIRAWTPHILVAPAHVNTLYYRPVQALTFLVDYQVYGLFAPGFHLTSLLCHALAGLLLYRFATRLLGDAVSGLVAALLFVVHPVHTEAVTYLSGRSDPLAAAFMLASLLWCLEPRRPIRSWAAFLLALLSRESAMGLLPLVVLTDVTDARRRGAPRIAVQRRLARYVPYGAAVALYLAIRWFTVGGDTHGDGAIDLPLRSRLLTMTTVVARYLALLVFPAHLQMERFVPPATSGLDLEVVASSALLVALSLAAYLARRRAWPLAFGWTWFLLALLPVANVVPLATFMAEHWLYVPSMGLFIALGWTISRLAARSSPRLVMVALGLVLVAYGARTARRNLDWRDARTIYETTLRDAPESARVHTNLGRLHWMAGEREPARRAFEQAIALRPNDAQTANAHNHLGIMAAQDHRYEQAIDSLERGLALDPGDRSLYVNLGLVFMEVGRLDDARGMLEHALAIDPRLTVAYTALGDVYLRAGDHPRALEQYERALALDPASTDLRGKIAVARRAEAARPPP